MINYKVENKETSLILCIFGGYLGLHHFYNKKIGLGLLYLFTAGLFYAGWIKDIIKLIKIKDNPTPIIKQEEIPDKYCLLCGNKTILDNLLCPQCADNLKKSDESDESNKISKNFTISVSFDDYNDEPKEKSLYKKTKTKKMVNDYVVFDLETTGLDYHTNKIIEIGALKYANNELIDKYNILINPQEHISSRITKITGIDDEMVKDCKTIDEVLPDFIQWIENYTLIAHNGSFDLGFIEAKIKELELEMINNKNIDTLYLSRNYITGTENYKLETLKEHFNLDYNSHRALEDCYVTNYIYQYCKNQKDKAT